MRPEAEYDCVIVTAADEVVPADVAAIADPAAEEDAAANAI